MFRIHKLYVPVLLFISILITSHQVYPQSSWFFTFRSLDINGMEFISSNTAIAAGQKGVIYKSTNGGNNWFEIYTSFPEYYYLWSVSFVNDNTGWTVGNIGVVAKTTDGGYNWTNQSSGVFEDLYSVYFHDAMTGWAAGREGKVIKTTNGGVNWNIQTTGTEEKFFNMSFINSQTGWIAGDAGVYRTTNGGAQWISQLSEPWVYSVDFVNSMTGWAGVRFGKIFKTTNSGSNWQLQNSGSSATFYSMKFINDQTGWAVGDYNTIIKTSNGGTNWIRQESEIPYTNMKFSCIDASDEAGINCSVVGFKGWIINTHNSGSNWKIASHGAVSNSYLWSLNFINDMTGWAAGLYGTILKTSTGGVLWSLQQVSSSRHLVDINFINANTGWACGHGGVIIKTTNSGVNWITQNSEIFSNSFNSFFIDHNTGWIAGDTGLLKTTNGGTTWKIALGEKWIYSVYFIDSLSGYAGVRFGKIMKTIDGGETWSNYEHPSGATFYSIKFVNLNTGWAVGDYNTILKTTNAGQTWFLQNSGLSGYHKFSDVNSQGSSGDTMWVTGFYGKILKTTNGGTNWRLVQSPAVFDLNSIQFSSFNTGYIAGGFGTILKSTNGGLTYFNPGNSVPGKFYLGQNYPNPFNPITKIRYEFQSAAGGTSYVMFKVFDILGKEFAVLVNQKQNAGRYKVEFDGTNFPSGVYFYSLIVDGTVVDTKRMILLK